MKIKSLFVGMIALGLVHCPITNQLFLKTSRVKGIEAKSILNSRLSSFFVNDLSTGSNDSLAADFMIPILAGIEDDKIYSRRDIENCATRIFLGAIAIDQPNITVNRNKKAADPLRKSNPQSRFYPPILCQLKSVDKFIDID